MDDEALTIGTSPLRCLLLAIENRELARFSSGLFYSGARMARPTKKIDAAALIGETALVRAAIWQNGRAVVAAIVTEATNDAALLPDKAIALVSLTAFPAGAPSRLMLDVPLYSGPQDGATLPAAWLKG
ncbi:hypothetical protein P5W99_24475 [Paraburkholderia sp. A3BS-1L]|uniref:hypothetical protein n=1 Tax=Paraburkholderia sp. A3BS-1L TaxID=3028375 RepID=UPI003DA84425